MDLRAGVRADVQTGAHGVMTTSALRPSRLPELDLRTPTSLEELTGSLAAGWRACGGGTDVLIEALQAGEPTHLVSTTGVHELAQLTCDADGISIGGSVVLARLVRSTSFRSGAAAVADGAQTIGSIQLRNQATLVGNLCSASPAADTIPGLFVHDARVETVDSSGMTRSTAVSEFLHGPGSTSLHDDEVVAAVRLTPSSPGTGSAYRRFTERNALDLAFAGVAASVALEADGVTIRSVRLALGAVGPTVMDASEVTATLIGRTADTELLASVAEAAAGACSPITDHRCSADYRRQLVHVLTLEVIDEAMRRAGRDDNSDPRVQQGKQR